MKTLLVASMVLLSFTFCFAQAVPIPQGMTSPERYAVNNMMNPQRPELHTLQQEKAYTAGEVERIKDNYEKSPHYLIEYYKEGQTDEKSTTN